MAKRTTVKKLKGELAKLDTKINKLLKKRFQALDLAKKLQADIDSLLGGASAGVPKKRGRKPGRKPGRRPRKKTGKKKVGRPRKKKVGRPKKAAKKKPVKSGTSFQDAAVAIVKKAGKPVPIERLAAQLEKKGFKFKNTRQVLNLQLKKMGLTKNAKGNVSV